MKTRIPRMFTFVLLFAWAAFQSPSFGQNTADVTTNYVLGPNDEITIRALDAEEITDKPYRVSSDGDLTLPMLGRVKAAGLTIQQLEEALVTAMKPYFRHPKVAVSIAEFRSQPVSVIGSVNSPGVLQLQGSKSLVEILSMVGGLRNDAGHSATITRKKEWGPLPLPGARPDATGQFSIAEVRLKDVLEARNPEQNITIRPNDIISVPRAEVVYVLGAVKRSGGFALGDRDTLSALQAVSLAEGVERTAAPQNAKILRFTAGVERRAEIPLDLKKIFAGKAADVVLQPDDILFVPDSGKKRAALRTLEALVTMGTTVGAGAIIYGR